MITIEQVALVAMQELIRKLPLHDGDGKLGVPSDRDSVAQLQADICESAFGYARCFMSEMQKEINREVQK